MKQQQIRRSLNLKNSNSRPITFWNLGFDFWNFLFLSKTSFLVLFFLTLANFQVDAQESPKQSPSKETKKLERHAKKAARVKQKKLELKQKEKNATSKALKTQNKLQANKGYMASTRFYESLGRSERNNLEAMTQMAEAYRLNNKTLPAESLYARIINQTDDPQHFLHYAQMLQQNGKCEDAIRWYTNYADALKLKNKERQAFLSSCDQLDAFKTHEEVNIQNLKALNSEHLDFSPMPYQNGLVFTSTREVSKVAHSVDCWTEDNFTDLFFAELNGDHFENIKPFKGEVNGKFHDGVASFEGHGNTMFFTRNNHSGENEQGVIDLKIYRAVNFNGFWSDVEEWEHNSDDFASCHPSLNSDGTKLYFSSNRPEGFGGMDVYVSELVDGIWTIPMNLGPTVNSSSNEVFPYLAHDGTLYFASSGFVGMGGLDIYAARKSNVTDESSWAKRYNLGKPFNTEKDEFGFVLSPDQKTGFFTSNRLGGLGGDDIYAWTKEEPLDVVPEEKDGKIYVFDEETGDGLAAVKLDIGDGFGAGGKEPKKTITLEPADETGKKFYVGVDDLMPKMKKFLTDKDGGVDFPVNRKKKYKVKLEKEGYLPLETEIDGADWFDKENYALSLSKAPEPEPALKNESESEKLLSNAAAAKAAANIAVAHSAPVCNCTVFTETGLDIRAAAPKEITRLGTNPEFGNSHGLIPQQFYEKLKTRYYSNETDRKFLDRIFAMMGYSNGFADANPDLFSNAELVPGTVGKIGYGKYHKSIFAILKTTGLDLKAFRIKAANGCDIHFLKTCGNHFFFCPSK